MKQQLGGDWTLTRTRSPRSTSPGACPINAIGWSPREAPLHTNTARAGGRRRTNYEKAIRLLLGGFCGIPRAKEKARLARAVFWSWLVVIRGTLDGTSR